MKTKIVKVQKSEKIKVSEDTQFVLTFPNKSSGDHYDIEVIFEKSGVSAEIIGLYTLNQNEILSFTTIARHKVPNTTCTTKVKGVLHDKTNCTYLGKIIIEKQAQQTSSFLEDAVLVLGENTHNRADPILEIEADDVAASHGSTTGRIDEDQIYYLCSRGISRSDAEELIVDGFFESILSELHDQDVREELSALVK